MIQKYPNYGQCGSVGGVGAGQPTCMTLFSIPLAQAMPIIKKFQEKGALGITLMQKFQLFLFFAEYKLPFQYVCKWVYRMSQISKNRSVCLSIWKCFYKN